MRTVLSPVVPLALALSVAAPLQAQDDDDRAGDEEPRLGHSAHGAEYDEGPRGRPWKMDR